MNNNINTVFTFNNGVPTGVTAHITETGALYTTDNTHPNWDTLLDAIRNDDVKSFITNIDVKTSFENYVEGNVKVIDNQVYFGNIKLHGMVVDRIFDFMRNNLPVRPMLRFIDKLYKNPSSRSVNELYNFLSHKNLPIVSNGNFRAYKGLMADSYSVTSGNIQLLHGTVREDGRIFNGVGETIECMRNSVNDNKDDTCSYGLHAGSYEYAKSFSHGKLVEVEIDPSDVVSVPSDCNAQKLRTCKYVVVAESVVPMNDTYIQTENDETYQMEDDDENDDDITDCDNDNDNDGDNDCCNCDNDDCCDNCDNDCDCDNCCGNCDNDDNDDDEDNHKQDYKNAYDLGVLDGVADRRNGDGDHSDGYNPTGTDRYKNYMDNYNNEMVECYLEGYTCGFHGKN